MIHENSQIRTTQRYAYNLWYAATLHSHPRLHYNQLEKTFSKHNVPI